MSGSAVVYQKPNKIGLDTTIVVPPRTAPVRKTNLGTSWTDIRMGFYLSLVNAVDPNASAASETVIRSSVLDGFVFGLKNSTNDNPPGYSTAYFLGLGVDSTQTNGCVCTPASGIVGDGSGACYINAYYLSSTQQYAVASGSAPVITCGTSPGVNSGYCGLFTLRLVVNNFGTKNQTITFYTVANSAITGADYSPSALRSFLTTTPNWSAVRNSNTTPLVWNDGNAAWPLPDAFYISNPLYLSRLRVSCMDAIMVTPVQDMSISPNTLPAVPVAYGARRQINAANLFVDTNEVALRKSLDKPNVP